MKHVTTQWKRNALAAATALTLPVAAMANPACDAVKYFMTGALRYA